MTKEAVSVLATRFAESISARRPSFRLFENAHCGFVRALNAISRDEIPGAEHMAMSALGSSFSDAKSDESRWGLIFVELWFCSNFRAALWLDLVTSDRSSAPCAVEHCYWVWALSGANGSADLAKVLDQTGTWDVVEPKLREIGDFPVPDAVVREAPRAAELNRNWIRNLRAMAKTT